MGAANFGLQTSDFRPSGLEVLSLPNSMAEVASLASGRMKANRVYLKYLTSKTKPTKTQALFAPSRLRDREASFPQRLKAPARVDSGLGGTRPLSLKTCVVTAFVPNFTARCDYVRQQSHEDSP